jgi:hypothetical protein
MREAAGLEVGEAIGRETGQVESRAPRRKQHLLGALGFEPNFGAIAELADNLVKRVRRNSRGPRRPHHRRDALGHFDVEVGRPQVDAAVSGLEQHIGEDGIGVAAFHHTMHVAQRLEQMVALESDFHTFASLAP